MDEKLDMFMETVNERFLDTLPEKVKKEIKNASVCKRLLNPDDCNPKCAMGYTFSLDGEQYQKCRYMAFQPTLSEENNPYIRQFLGKELQGLYNTKTGLPASKRCYSYSFVSSVSFGR